MNTTNPNDSNDSLSKTPFKNFAIGVVIILVFLIGHSLLAQVGIGNTSPQALLDISASNRTSPTNQDGILIPRVTNLPADASMTVNQDGMMVFYDNTGEDGKGFYYWDDTANDWIKIATGNLNDDDWTVNGANIERQSGNVYIGDVPSTNNDLYISDQIIDWDNVSYIINPDGDNKINEIELDDGGLTDPSLYFEGDSDFGLTYNPLSNKIFLVENGSQRLGLRKDGGIEPYNGIKIGIGSGSNNTSNTNIFIGQSAGSSNTVGILNYGIGTSSLSSTTNNGINVAIGHNALTDYIGNSVPGNNVSIGHYSMSDMIDGSLNTAVGIGAMENINFNSNSNVAVGTYALRNLASGTENTVLGYSAGNSSDGFHNLYLGFGSGYNADGDRNIFLGYRSGYNAPTGSDMLYIENSNSNTPLVYGEFDNDILRINGELQVGIPTATGYAFPAVDGTANQVMTTDGAGNVSFQNVPGDGTGTDDQNLTAASLTGTTLNLGIENGTGTSVNLATLQDGIGTDDQTIDNFSLVGTTLSLSLEDDGQPLQTVNLASLQDGTGTDDQNIQNLAFNTSTNILTVGIENGTSQTVNLSALDSGGDITQVNAGSGMTGGGTTGTITVNAIGTNGLLTYADDIRLGGALTQNTQIALGTQTFDINLNNTGDFAIQDNGTDVFFVEDTGDIGIGNSNPAYPLHISESVNGTARAVFIEKTDNLGTETSGLYVEKIGNGSGRSHAIFTNVDGTGTSQKYGVFNRISSSANGGQYGTRNFLSGATGSFQFGTFNNLDNSGTGNQYGVYNGMRGASASNLFGVYNEFERAYSGVNIITGVRNRFTNGNPGTDGMNGIYTDFTTSANGIYYGVRNEYTAAATGTGTKYGTYNIIDANAGGVHFGTYNNVNINNGWAGYFIGKSYVSNKLGIGTGATNPDGYLEVRANNTGTQPNINLVDIGDSGARINFSNTATTNGNVWTLFGDTENSAANSRFNIFHPTGGNIIQILGDGLVGINRAPTTNSLEVNGNASKNTAGGWLANSDRRLKKDIKTIDGISALEKLMELRGVTYYWNDKKTGIERPDDIQYGFIAQELMEVFPEKVTKDAQGYYQTAYGDYDALFVQAIKELKNQIERITAENRNLKAQLNKMTELEARLSAIEKSINSNYMLPSVANSEDD